MDFSELLQANANAAIMFELSPPCSDTSEFLRSPAFF